MPVRRSAASSPAAPGAGRGAALCHDLDHLGQRRLSARETWVWYLVAAASYIMAGIWQKGLLNWIIGPAWLVVVVVVGPMVWDLLRPSRR